MPDKYTTNSLNVNTSTKNILNLDEVKQHILDIAANEVIEKYVPLKKQGRLYTACCPFHTENSTSLKVYSFKGSFTCYLYNAI